MALLVAPLGLLGGALAASDAVAAADRCPTAGRTIKANDYVRVYRQSVKTTGDLFIIGCSRPTGRVRVLGEPADYDQGIAAVAVARTYVAFDYIFAGSSMNPITPTPRRG